MERFLLMIFPKFQLLELVSSTFHRYEGSPIKSYSNILWRISNDPSVICVEISAAPSVANFALPRMAKMTQFPSCKFRWHFEIRFWSFFTCTSSKRCIFFSYPFVFLEWNIYLILKNHIDRKHPTSPPLLAWIFSWMNGSKKNILLEKDLFDFTFSTFSTKKIRSPCWFLFAAYEVYPPFAIPKQKIMAISSPMCIIKPYQHSNLSIFSSKKTHSPTFNDLLCHRYGINVLGIQTSRGNLTVREKKQQGPRRHQSCIDLNNQNFWIKRMRFIYHVLTLRQVFRIWRFDKLTKSLKRLQLHKNPRSYQPHFCQEIKTCKQKNLEAPKNRSSWSKKSQLEANEILEFHTKVFQQADLLPQSTYLRDTSIHCFFWFE